MMKTTIATDSRAGRFRAWVGALLLGGALLVPAAGSVGAHEAHGHPARIHEGTCDALGRVAFRLNGVGGGVDLDNAPVPTPAAVNPAGAYQVMVSETVIDATLDDMLAAEHAVMIYESDEAMDAIACGNLGGAMDGDTLITGLAEMGVPGHLGFAFFSPDGEGTVVSLVIGHAMAPVSATGAKADHEHSDDAAHEDEAAGDDHEHEGEDDHDAVATPSA
jgi:hypothetical protein